MYKKTLLIVFSLLMVFVLTACHSNNLDSHSETHQKNDHVHLSDELGDRYEVTSGVDELPKFLNGFDPQIAAIYQLVARNDELLQWIPCYCGCGESVQHKSNRECFISQVNADGSIKWTSHGTTCGVCLEIAVESVKLNKEGKSILEIRQYIDQKYAQGFAKPTDTPLPAQ